MVRRHLYIGGLAVLAILLSGAAAEFRLSGADGGELTHASLATGDTLVVVWASWSPRCRDLPERMAKLKIDWGKKAEIVSVNFQEEKAVVREYLASSPLGVPTYLDRDGQFSKDHAVTTLPGLLVYREGSLVLKATLGADTDRALRRSLGS